MRLDENTLFSIVPGEVSSPSAPFQIVAMHRLYRTTNNARVPNTAETREAGPTDSAHRKVISPKLAVINSLVETNIRAGLSSLKNRLTSHHGSGLRLKIKNTMPSASILNPCVNTSGNSSRANLPITLAAPKKKADSISK